MNIILLKHAKRRFSGASEKGVKSLLSAKLEEQAPQMREYFKNWKAENSHKILNKDVTVAQALGMKGIKSIICETSMLDDKKGIRFRGYTMKKVCKILPKTGKIPETAKKNFLQPKPEGLFYLLLTGKVPTKEEADAISQDLISRAKISDYTKKLIDSYPKDLHPMAQLSGAFLSMSNESHFRKAYFGGINKKEYYKTTFEDGLNIIAKSPVVAARIYRNMYHNGKHLEVEESEDISSMFSQLMGFNGFDFSELMRLYLTMHADHEGGNVSAHSCHLAGSALSDPYTCYSSAVNGLAGPLHGLANQQVLNFVKSIDDSLQGGSITADKLIAFVQNTLNSGKVIPGFGHAVLRITDPRFTVQKIFAEKYLTSDNRLIRIVSMLSEIVPGMLMDRKKVGNPYPNVDNFSGALLHSFGLTESNFYTVLFAVSRSIGVMTNLTISRIYGLPIERPKSVTTKWVTDNIK